MKETITPDIINAVQKILKHCATFDGQTYNVDIFDSDEIAPCSLTQAFFPEIIDMALEHFKRKASHSLVEWIEKEPKTCNVEYVRNEGVKFKNRENMVFEWRLIQ